MSRKEASVEYRRLWHVVGGLRFPWITYTSAMSNLIGFASI